MTDNSNLAILAGARQTRQRRENSLLSNTQNFGESLLSALGPEAIGFKPSPNLTAWRDSHPVLSTTSSAIGLIGGVIGFGKIGVVKKAGTFATKLAVRSSRSPSFIRKLARNNKYIRRSVIPGIVADAGYEATRQTTALALGNKNTSDALFDTGVNVAAGVAIGTGIGTLSTTVGAAARKSISALSGKIDLAPQLKLRDLYKRAEEAKTTGVEGYNDQQVRALEGSYVSTILRRRPEELKKYVQDKDPKGKIINSIVKDSIGFEQWVKQPSLKFSDAPTSVGGKASLARQLLGLEDSRVFQYLDQARIIQGDKFLDASFAISLQVGKVGDGFLVPIPEGNFFVLRKVQSYDALTKKKDTWLAFKTDNPGVFFPREALATKKAIDEHFGTAANLNYAKLTEGNDLMSRVNASIDNVEVLFPNLAIKSGTLGSVFAKLDPTLKKFFGDSFEVFSDAAKKYFAPALFRWDHDSTLGALSASAQLSADLAAQQTSKTLDGIRRSAQLGKSEEFALASTFIGTGTQQGGLINEIKRVREIGPDAWKDYQFHLNERTSTASLQKLVDAGELDKQVFDVLQIRESEFNNRIIAFNKLNDQFGLPRFKPVAFHRGGRRDRPGKFIQRVYFLTPDGQNRVSYLISDESRVAVNKKADYIVNKLKSEGTEVDYFKGEAQVKGEPNYDIGAGFQQDYDIITRNRELLNHPTAQRVDLLNEEFGLANRQKSSYNVPGYENLEYNQDIKSLRKNLSEFDNMLAFLTYKMKFTDAFDGMRALDGKTFDEFDTFVKSIFRQSNINQDDGVIVNAVKEPFKKLLGNDLVRSVGSFTSSFIHFQNFAGNLNYAAMQAISVFNTIIPQLQFLTRAPVEELSKYYSHYPILNRLTGDIVTASNTPDLPSMLQDTFQTLRKPDAQMTKLLNRANSEGIFNPQFQRELDDVLTPDSNVNLFKSIADNPNPVDAIKQMMLLPASASEQFQRITAFTLMSKMLQRLGAAGKRIDGSTAPQLNDDDIFNFASQFVSNTMYQYQATRRARIFNGALNPLGLFKNWTFHSLGTGVSYFRQGFKQNDWAPLMAHTAMIAATGGLRAAPFWGLGRGLLSLVEDEDLYQNFLAQAEDDDLGSSLLFYGIPSITGAVLTSNLESPLTDIDALSNTFTNFAVWDKGTQVADVIGSGMKDLQRGETLSSSPEFRRKFAGAFFPRAILRAMNATQGDYLKSQRTGNPIASHEKFNNWMYGLGFNGIQLQKIYETRQEIWKDSRKRRETLSYLSTAYVEAQLQGDTQEMQRFLGIATAVGIPLDNFMRSTTRKKEVQNPINIRATYNQIDKISAEQVLTGERDQGRAGF